MEQQLQITAENYIELYNLYEEVWIELSPDDINPLDYSFHALIAWFPAIWRTLKLNSWPETLHREHNFNCISEHRYEDLIWDKTESVDHVND